MPTPHSCHCCGCIPRQASCWTLPVQISALHCKRCYKAPIAPDISGHVHYGVELSSPGPSGGQQDAAEFLQTLCPLLYSTVDKFEWEARHTPCSLDVPSEVSDSGTLLPLPLTVALASDRDNSHYVASTSGRLACPETS